MPLGPEYDKLIDSKIADMKNTGGRHAGSVTAAQFLQRFVENDTPWAHLDVAGTAMGSPAQRDQPVLGLGLGRPGARRIRARPLSSARRLITPERERLASLSPPGRGQGEGVTSALPNYPSPGRFAAILSRRGEEWRP